MKTKLFQKPTSHSFKIKSQLGQGAVIVILSMLGLLTMTALIVDSGRLLVQRRRTQNAADAASIAAARELGIGSDDATIYNSVQLYGVTLNKASAVDAYYYPSGDPVGAGEVPEDAIAVVISATMKTPTIFAGLLGIDELVTHAQSSGGFGAVSQLTSGVYPIAVEWEDFEFGETYNIFAGGGPGNFGWLGWTGCTNTPCLCESLTPPGNSDTYINPYNPSDHTLTIGDWVEGTTGKKNAACVRELLSDFKESQQPITIVVWDEADGNGANLNYKIAGFATFVIEDFKLQHNKIKGHFIEWTIPKAQIDPDAPDFGVRGISLIK